MDATQFLGILLFVVLPACVAYEVGHRRGRASALRELDAHDAEWRLRMQNAVRRQTVEVLREVETTVAIARANGMSAEAAVRLVTGPLEGPRAGS